MAQGYFQFLKRSKDDNLLWLPTDAALHEDPKFKALLCFHCCPRFGKILAIVVPEVIGILFLSAVSSSIWFWPILLTSSLVGLACFHFARSTSTVSQTPRKPSLRRTAKHTPSSQSWAPSSNLLKVRGFVGEGMFLVIRILTPAEAALSSLLIIILHGRVGQ